MDTSRQSKKISSLELIDIPQIFLNIWDREFSQLNSAYLLSNLSELCSHPKSLRLAKNGQLILAESYSDSTSSKIEFKKVFEQFDGGATLIIQDLHIPFRNLIEKIVPHISGIVPLEKIQLNAYITPPNASGFPIHWDLHEALLIQVEGEKRWDMWSPIDAKPFFSAEVIAKQELIENLEKCVPPIKTSVLKPSEILHIPRGFLHKGKSSKFGSLHFTVGYRPPTVLDALLKRFNRHDEKEYLSVFLKTQMNKNSYATQPNYIENLIFLTENFKKFYAKNKM